MSGNEVPFYAQTVLLDRLIHSDNPAADPDALEVILRALKTKPDLRAYFFRSGPSAAWASILWEHGFFGAPPEPEKTNRGYVLPHWDVQSYLENVAPQAVDIVINHINTVIGHGWYISRAISALRKIPSETAEVVVPRLVSWLEEPQVGGEICDEATELMRQLTRDGRVDSALTLFAALVSPRISSGPGEESGGSSYRPDRIANAEEVLGSRSRPSEAFELLREAAPERVIRILEAQLMNSLRLNTETEQAVRRASPLWWRRSAIEDTDQDTLDTVADYLLRAFRDTLYTLVSADTIAARPLVEGNLKSEHPLFRRIGLYILRLVPQIYLDLTTRELLNPANLEDIEIHHEYFLLLRDGFAALDQAHQHELVRTILQGPDKKKAEVLAEWANQQYGEDKEAYVLSHSRAWMRDRLWMIRDHLEGSDKLALRGLLEIVGEPQHPDFLSWHSGAFWVQDVSPVSEQQIAEMDPAALVSFLKTWRPIQQERFGPVRVSYQGMANAIADAVISNPDRYASILPRIVGARPEYGSTLFDRWWKPENIASVPWALALNVSHDLLDQTQVWSTESQGSFEESWRSVRLAIARLLLAGLSRKESRLPVEHLPAALEVLLSLADDPDPSLEADRPKEGWAGHNDPITVALNHVRPIALTALIHFALFRVEEVRQHEEVNYTTTLHQVEPIIQELLTRKLDKALDPSRAVHSIYGQYLPQLYWLDKNWVQLNIGRIFPNADSEENAWFFVSAWDAFIFNDFRPYMVDLLRPFYLRAVSNPGMGYISKTHLGVAQRLAAHVALEYMLADYDLESPLGQQSLLAEFFKGVPIEMRKDIPWALWRICANHPDHRKNFWTRAKAVWQWRYREASASNHSSEFTEEMEQFAQLLLVAPDNETISTLRPLLEGLLPHLGRFEYRNHGWDALEKHLAEKVIQDPIESIRLYRQMYDQRTSPPRWVHHSDESRRIVEIAAADPSSRKEALSLVDMLARQNDHEFRDVYDRYA